MIVPGIVLAAAALSAGTPDPVAAARERYRSLQSYQVTVVSSAAGRGSAEKVRYFYRKPGFVRMEFIQPHSGAVLIYRPSDHKARLWPFGLHTLPVLTLSPRNPLIVDPRGHTVDRSDAGPLLDNVRMLQAQGQTVVLGTERVGRRQALHLVITGGAGETVEGVHRYHLWLDLDTGFPIKASSYDLRDALIETVLMDDVEINAPFPTGFFSP